MKSLQEIQQLIEMVSEIVSKSDISHFEMEEGGLRIKLVRGTANHAGVDRTTGAAADKAVAEVTVSEGNGQPAGVTVPPPAAVPAADLHEIKSPIVGTFYRAPNPDADPFVETGSRVQAGQTLCIVEAMKLMNEIESDVAGEVVEVVVASGQPVEYGEVLFRIRPGEA